MEQMTLFQPPVHTECNPLHAVVIPSDVPREVVIDRLGRTGEVMAEDSGFILIRWEYGQFCMRKNTFPLNADGVMDCRLKR